MTGAPKRRAFYTTGEIARLCQVTKRTVITWIDSGKLKGFRLPGGSHRRVAAADVAAFMKGSGIPDLERHMPRRRILVVDDDADFAGLLEDALQDRYDVVTAPTALEAASRLAEFQPDLVLLDVRLPDVNGLDVCRHFLDRRGDGRAPAIFVMSAYGREIGPAALRRSGADAFLSKPVRIADLRKRIRGRVG
ncbi:MAG TPA: response regulator [Planctomycetota bacterium]|nr:response regulator [Planctomycetota bacterium]